MEVHRAFGLAGGATGKGNQSHIVTTGGMRLKRSGMVCHARFNAVSRFRPKPQHLL
jgi:hypothetical protein